MAKIRAVVNGVHFYTNTSAIKKQTSGDASMQNAALYHALYIMGKNPGIATTVVMYDGKMKKHSFEVQLSEV